MLRLVMIPLFSLVLTISLAGSAMAKCPAGDLNGDCRVNLQDLQFLSEQWLAPPESSADLNGDEEVGVADLALLAKHWNRVGIPLVINEVLASNSTIRDPEGEYDDWIEICNAGNEAIDIGGMYLTDDLDNPTMWRIPDDNPASTTIAANGYKVIWADNDTADPGLHANFKLNALGDEIGLFDADGPASGGLIDSIDFGKQTGDISYGRYPDANDNLRFMAFPTPGMQNVGFYLGFVADTKFSHDRGFYDEPFSVTIAAETEGAFIYYTLDGSAAFDADRGRPAGLLYTGPISITTTSTLRAVAWFPGWKASDMDTHTYIFLDDVIRQPWRPAGFPTNWGHAGGDYEMDPEVVNDPCYSGAIRDDLKAVATLSLVMNRNDWFGGGGQGIYIQGELSERAVSAELILPDGREGFQIDCAVMIVGGSSVHRWKMDKLSMRLKFRGAYGPSRLRFPVFGDEATDEFDTLVVDARMNNSWAYGGGVMLPSNSRPWISGRPTQRDVAQYTRDQFVSDIQNAMGGYAPYGRHVHLYLNGLYWGLYWLHERPDEHFAADYFGGDAEDYDVLKHNSGRVINGSGTNYNQMFSIANAGLASTEQYELVQQYLDVPDLVGYMIANFYVGNTDWAHHNWYATRSRVDPDGRWRYHSWDAEHVMEALYADVTGKDNSGGPTRLHRRLAENAEYRMLFADHVHRYFFNDGPLIPEGATDLYWIRLNEVDRAVLGESARWGDNHSSTPYTRDIDWVRERDWLLNEYFPQRSGIVLGQLKSRGLYPNTDAPVFHINGSYQHGGYIWPGDMLSMTATTGTIYYTLDGSDPRLPETSGGTISGTTLVAENAAKRASVPTGLISDNWKGGGTFDHSSWTSGSGGLGFERGSGYEGFISIDVGTQMYSKNATCYIRIPFTVGAELSTFNALTLRIRYDDAFVAYINGVEVDRRNFTGTPAWNSGASSSHSDSEAVNFENINISTHLGTLQVGDNILAIHGLNRGTTSSDFLISAELIAGESSLPGDEGISPTATEYGGPITLTDTTQVKARVLSGSTWSALNEAVFATGPVAENLRITEIMYHPQDTNDPNDPNEEFVELQNIAIETINLNLVRFTNGVDFAFPSMELAAGEYVLVVKDINAFEAQYGPGLNIAGQYFGNLRNGGERIELEDAAGRSILNFRYRDGWYDITDGMGFSLAVKDPVNTEPNAWDDKSAWRPSANIGGSPGWDDTDEIPALGSVKINEILAHSHAEASDWIELHNTTGERIHIGGWFLSDDNDDLMKYEIADGTWIDPCGYIVFYQNEHFGNIVAPGCHSSFALSENGETLYLHSGRDGVLTGYSEEEKFDASETGVAFGRYMKSTSTHNFVAMSENTPGSPNAYPKIGPVVINEIMYHPQNDGDAEYVELLNISGGPIDLQEWDNQQDRFVPWRFSDEGGISFDFPLGTTMTAGEYILLVRNLSAFESEYGAVGGGVQVFEWELGKLDNGSEKVELSKPGDEVEGERYYIRVDRVNYSDGSHPVGEDLWPTEPDGAGSSLSRKESEDYGNDVINWKAASPSAGDVNP